MPLSAESITALAASTIAVVALSAACLWGWGQYQSAQPEPRPITERIGPQLSGL